GLGVDVEQLGNIIDSAVAEFGCFDGRVTAPVLFAERVEKRLYGRLDGSSIGGHESPPWRNERHQSYLVIAYRPRGLPTAAKSGSYSVGVPKRRSIVSGDTPPERPSPVRASPPGAAAGQIGVAPTAPAPADKGHALRAASPSGMAP